MLKESTSPRFSLFRFTHHGLAYALSLAVSLGACSLFALKAQAGTAVVVSEGNESTFEYNDSMLRVGMGAENYAVVRDGSFYTVISEGGNVMVMDAGSMIRGFSQSSSQLAPSDFTANVVSLDKTNRTETVAGIIGDVYEITVEEEDGTSRTEELVLSTDKRARELRDALFLMMDVAAMAASPEAVEQGADIKSRLDKLDAGVLRFGTQMTLKSIDSAAVDPARFELPAAPMNLEGLGGMLGAMGQGAGDNEAGEATESDEAPAKSGGLFSSMMGALGGKADRQVDRAGNTVDNEIDKETDEAVDKGISKALGKLFGN